MITTGVRAGAVHFRCETYDAEPPCIDGAAAWDTVQEVSVNFRFGDVRLLDIELAQTDTFPDRSLVGEPGIYRARLYEAGQKRMVPYLALDDDLVERYFLQI